MVFNYNVGACAVRQVSVSWDAVFAIGVHVGRIDVLGCVTNLVKARPVRLTLRVDVYFVVALLGRPVTGNWTLPWL